MEFWAQLEVPNKDPVIPSDTSKLPVNMVLPVTWRLPVIWAIPPSKGKPSPGSPWGPWGPWGPKATTDIISLLVYVVTFIPLLLLIWTMLFAISKIL